MHHNAITFLSFDCEQAPDSPSEIDAAQREIDAARRSKRCQSLDDSAPCHEPELLLFDCEAVELPEGTPAKARPPGKERRVPTDDA